MTDQQAIEKLKALIPKEEYGGTDVEAVHAAADDILCELLNSLGYHAVVKLWQQVPKWYA